MKRRLELMPEVLPAPSKVESGGATSAVRARTLARLRVLAAVGAGIAAACSGKTEGTPGAGGSSSGGGGGGGPDGGLPDGSRPDSGDPYGVVDPLPPPACFEYATPPTAVASFVTVEDAGVDASGDPDAGEKVRYARVVVTLNQKDVAVGTVDLGDGVITIVEKTLNAGSIELVLRQPPNTGTFQTRIDIQTSCSKGPTHVTVNVTENGAGLAAAVSFYGQP